MRGSPIARSSGLFGIRFWHNHYPIHTSAGILVGTQFSLWEAVRDRSHTCAVVGARAMSSGLARYWANAFGVG